MLNNYLNDPSTFGSAVPWYIQIGAGMGSLVMVFSIILSGLSPTTPTDKNVTQSAGFGVTSSIAMVDPDGAEVYQRVCSSCHGAEGQGTTGVFPPVSGTEWVTGDEGRLIRLILHGLEGTIEVKGITYSRPMPGWGQMLDDEEVAAVVNYMRTSWENDAETITPEDVERVREATEGRRDAWAPSDFEDEENLGIPGQEQE